MARRSETRDGGMVTQHRSYEGGRPAVHTPLPCTMGRGSALRIRRAVINRAEGRRREKVSDRRANTAAGSASSSCRPESSCSWEGEAGFPRERPRPRRARASSIYGRAKRERCQRTNSSQSTTSYGSRCSSSPARCSFPCIS